MNFDSVFSDFDNDSIDKIAQAVFKKPGVAFTLSWDEVNAIILKYRDHLQIEGKYTNILMYGDTYRIRPCRDFKREVIEAGLVVATNNQIPKEFSVSTTVHTI